MTIVELNQTAYMLVCSCTRTFKTRRGGLSVECPHCGNTALTADLVLSHLTRQEKDSKPAAYRQVA